MSNFAASLIINTMLYIFKGCVCMFEINLTVFRSYAIRMSGNDVIHSWPVLGTISASENDR